MAGPPGLQLDGARGQAFIPRPPQHIDLGHALSFVLFSLLSGQVSGSKIERDAGPNPALALVHDPGDREFLEVRIRGGAELLDRPSSSREDDAMTS
jgi:hypothetical protein